MAMRVGDKAGETGTWVLVGLTGRKGGALSPEDSSCRVQCPHPISSHWQQGNQGLLSAPEDVAF